MSGCINVTLPKWKNVMEEYNLTRGDIHIIFNAETDSDLTEEQIKQKLTEFSKFNTYYEDRGEFKKKRHEYNKLAEELNSENSLLEMPYTEDQFNKLAATFGEDNILRVGNKMVVKKPMLHSREFYMNRKQKAEAGIKLMQYNSKRIAYYSDSKADNALTNVAKGKTRSEADSTNTFSKDRPITALVSSTIGTVVDDLLRAEFEGKDCRTMTDKAFTNKDMRDAIHEYVEQFRSLLNEKFGKNNWHAVTSDLTLRSNLHSGESVQGVLDILIYTNDGKLFIADFKTKKGGQLYSTVFEGNKYSEEVQYKRQIAAYTEMIKAQYGDFFTSIESLGLFVLPLEYNTPQNDKTTNTEVTKDWKVKINGREYTDLSIINSIKGKKAVEIQAPEMPYQKIEDFVTVSKVVDIKDNFIEEDLDESLTEDLKFTHYHRDDLKVNIDDTIAGKSNVSRPTFRTTTSALQEAFYYNKIMSMEEKRNMANITMANVSALISKLQKDPDAKELYFPDLKDSIDLTKLSREDIIKTVGIKPILDAVREEYFNVVDPFEGTGGDTLLAKIEGLEEFLSKDPDNSNLKEALNKLYKTKEKMEFISNNWDEFCKLGYAKLIENEGISIINNNIEGFVKTDELDFEMERTLDFLEEQHWESWQQGNNNKSAIGSLSTLMRRMYSRLPIIEGGKRVRDPYGFGIPMYVDSHLAANSILEWCKECTTLEDMIEVLKTKEDSNSWVSSILDMLGEYASDKTPYQMVRSQFFQNTRKDFTKYGIINFAADNYGNLTPIVKIINTSTKEDHYLSRVISNLVSNNVPVFNYISGSTDVSGVIDKDALKVIANKFTKVDSALKRYKGSLIDGTTIEVEKDLSNFTSAVGSLLKEFGFSIEEDIIRKTISENVTSKNHSFITDLVGTLKNIRDNFTKASNRKDDSVYSIFKYGDADQVKNRYKEVIEKFLPYIPDTIESSVYENGKMYYSFVTPSSLGKTITKLGNKMLKSPIEYAEYLEDNFYFSNWFRFNDVVLTPWLRMLEEKDSLRQMLDHKVQLHSNKVSYKEMSKIAYAQSLLLEFFHEKNKEKNSNSLSAWYRVPILSNKPSSEFIRFVRYTGNYGELISEELVNVLQQETLRIITVLKNAKSSYKGSKTEHFDLEGVKPEIQSKLDNDEPLTAEDFAELTTKGRNYGAEFKFLEFLNASLTDADSQLGEFLREKINSGSLGVSTEAVLQALFKEELKSFMDKAVQSEIDYMESIGLFEVEGDGNRVTYKYLKDILPEDKSYSYYLKKALESQKSKEANAILEKETNSKIVSSYMQIKNKQFVQKVNEKILELMREDINDRLSEYVWNDSFASLNIIQLTVGDLAFFKNTEDFQKRFAQVHSPGLRLNTEAEFDDNGVTRRYSDGINRSVYIKDENIMSEAYENIRMVFDSKIANSRPEEKAKWRTIRDDALKALEGFNPTDGQAYSCPTSSRKKLAMAGKWTDAMERAYKRIKSGNFNISDVELLIQPSKPFNSAWEKVSTDGPMGFIKRSVQHKNSEYTLIIADALLGQNSDTTLRAILDVMEESAEDNGVYNGKGIDTIMFGSCVKVGRSQEIDLNGKSPNEVREILRNSIYRGGAVNSNNYNTNFVHETLFEDYMIQQEVPAHFVDHEQLFGSQFRILSVSDITPETKFNVFNEDLGIFEEKDDKALKEEYFSLIAENIENSFKQLIKDFGLEGLSRSERNKKISEILQNNISKDVRYGHDLYMAVSLDSNDEFNIPLNDPIQSIRIQQLLNSIIKSRINKQTLHGGPIVQTTGYGLSEDLSMVWVGTRGKYKDKKLPTFSEWKNETGSTSVEGYRKFINEFGGEFAYFECYLPIPFDENDPILKLMTKEDGSYMTIEEAIEKGYMTEEQRKAIGYRIPTEDKYSMMPMYIKGFTPKSGGEAIMLPKEITALTGADFDIDKMYTIIKDYDIKSIPRGGKSIIKQADINQVVKNNLKEENLIEVGIPSSVLEAVLTGKYSNLVTESFSSLVRKRMVEGDQFLTNELSDAIESYADVEKLQNLVNNFVEKYWEELSDKVSYTPINYTTSINKYKKGSREYNNNRIFDLQWAVLTNNDTLTKLFRPQSFEEQRHTAKIVNAAKNSKGKGASYKAYSKMTNEMLDRIAGDKSNKSILFTSTQIRYHNQNMVAGSLIGIFANNNVSHAFVQMQDIKLRFIDNKGFSFDGVTIDNDNNNSISEIKDRQGDLISRRIASFLGASVDAVKDPILNYLNLNTATAGVAMLLTRLGFDSDAIGLLLTQPIIEEICDQYFKLNNEGYVNMGDVIDSKFKELLPNSRMSDIDLMQEGFTKEELFNRITSSTNNNDFDGKILALFKTLHTYAQHLNTLTFMTKFNSVSNAVGPTIADTMVMKNRVNKFKDLMKDEDSAPFNSEAIKVIDNNPILSAFFENTVGDEGAAEKMFSPYFPHYSTTVEGLINSIVDNTKSPLDAKTINTIINDFMYYCMTDKVIATDAKTRSYYIHNFPEIANTIAKEYSRVPALRYMYLSPAKTKKPIITMNTSVGGMKIDQQEEVKASWADLLASENLELQQLAYEKAMYMLMKNGFSFSPTGDMHLLGTAAKQMIPGYIEALRDMDTFNIIDTTAFIDQLVRNRHNNYKLVPNIYNFKKVIPKFNGNQITLTGDSKDLYQIIVKREADGKPKFCNYIKYKNKLYQINPVFETDINDSYTVHYTEISKLGVTNNIIEYNMAEGVEIESVVNIRESESSEQIVADEFEEYYDESPNYGEITNETAPQQDDAVVNPDSIIQKVFSSQGEMGGGIEAYLEQLRDGKKNIPQQTQAISTTNNVVEEAAKSERVITNPVEIIEMHSAIVEYNLNNPDKVATLSGTSNSKVVTILDKTIANMLEPDKVAKNKATFDGMMRVLRGAGFDVAIDDTLTEGARAVFDPTRASVTSEGLITVIRFADNKAIEESLPEEFSHFIIEGLKNHGLVTRILNAIKDNNLAEDILGDEYERYKDLYEGDQIRLNKEAAGKLLAAHISGDSDLLHQLLSRLEKVAMDKFRSISESTIRDIIMSTEQLAQLSQSDEVIPLIDKSLVLSGKALYQIEQHLDRLRKQAEMGIKVKSRRMRAELSKKRGGFESGYAKKDIKALKKMQLELDQDNYINSVGFFLQDAVQIMKDLNLKLSALNPGNIKESVNPLHINKCCAALNSIREFIEGYEDILQEISGTTTLAAKEDDGSIQAMSLANLAKIAGEVVGAKNALLNVYNDTRFNASYAFLRMYWGNEDKVIDIGKHKGEKLVLEELLREGLRDLGLLDRWISSMSDVNDPLLSTLDKSVKIAQAERDKVLQELIPTLRQAHLDFKAQGGNPEFIYERDENGVPTGRYKSNINYDKYYKERREEIERLKEEGHKGYALRERLKIWEDRHCEKVLVDPTYGEEGRWEIRPKQELYPSNALDSLTSTERKYYDFIMDAKAKIDSLLPQRYVSQHKAVQMRSDVTESLLASKMGVKEKTTSIFKQFKEKFLITEDDEAEYGEDDTLEDTQNDSDGPELFDDLESEVDDQQISDDDNSEEESKASKLKKKIARNKYINLDASGKRRMRKVPVFYTRFIKDKTRLTTDLTGSLIAYTAMAVNYSEMNKIVDCLELVKDTLSQRKVKQLSGDQKLVETYSVLGKIFSDDYSVKGRRIEERLEDYFDSVIYGQHKRDEGQFRILGKKISTSKTLDAIKDYSGNLGLALNAFSGISNVTIGKVQMFIESQAKQYFTYKDMAKAKAEYYKLLFTYIGQSNAVNPNNRLKLLMDKFDVTDSFYRDLQNDNVYNSSLVRLLGNSSLMFLNSAGEHYLRNRTMLAMLYNYKVLDKKNNKEVSLYEALKEADIYKDSSNKEVVGKKIIFDNDNYSKTDGSEFTESDFINMRLRISKVNGSLNGQFGETDKGAIHRYALGRLAMQFRQWMPGHYYRRFAGTYYDAQLDEFREGYYGTTLRFTGQVLKDLKKLKFTVITNWRQLKPKEKQNIKRALAEQAVFTVLTALCCSLGPVKDLKKGPWANRMLAYTLLRMKMEVSASSPLNLFTGVNIGFLNNIVSTLNSPAAAINSVDRLSKLLLFWNAFDTIDSGRWAGHSVYTRDFVRAIPPVDKIINIIDLDSSDGTRMFSYFDSQIF